MSQTKYRDNSLASIPCHILNLLNHIYKRRAADARARVCVSIERNKVFAAATVLASNGRGEKNF